MCLFGTGVDDLGVFIGRTDRRGGGVLDCDRSTAGDCRTTVAIVSDDAELVQCAEDGEFARPSTKDSKKELEGSQTRSKTPHSMCATY